MKLKEYLKEEGIKQSPFANKIGITVAALRYILAGRRDIHLSLACRIEDVTKKDGIPQVTCRDLVLPRPLKLLEERSKELKERSK